MSVWRKEASRQLPELQPIIASRNVDNPMMLWLELRSQFEHLLDRKATRRILPQIMTRRDYVKLKALLLYHNSEEEFAKGLKLFDDKEAR